MGEWGGQGSGIQKGRQANRQTGGLTDRQAGRQADRQPQANKVLETISDLEWKMGHTNTRLDPIGVVAWT